MLLSRRSTKAASKPPACCRNIDHTRSRLLTNATSSKNTLTFLAWCTLQLLEKAVCLSKIKSSTMASLLSATIKVLSLWKTVCHLSLSTLPSNSLKKSSLNLPKGEKASRLWLISLTLTNYSKTAKLKPRKLSSRMCTRSSSLLLALLPRVSNVLRAAIRTEQCCCCRDYSEAELSKTACMKASRRPFTSFMSSVSRKTLQLRLLLLPKLPSLITPWIPCKVRLLPKLSTLFQRRLFASPRKRKSPVLSRRQPTLEGFGKQKRVEEGRRKISSGKRGLNTSKMLWMCTQALRIASSTRCLPAPFQQWRLALPTSSLLCVQNSLTCSRRRRNRR
mmetsp:Transcript_37320/g.73389  ORF Transcript_37320/g.73389 Transcript_37320/m.73389 type:complete len:333 (-) Transcript_37320:995-1993(-)